MKKVYLSPQIQVRIQAQIEKFRKQSSEDIQLETRNLLKRAKKIKDQQYYQTIKKQVPTQKVQPFNASPNLHLQDFIFKVDKRKQNKQNNQNNRNYSYHLPQGKKNRTYTDYSYAFSNDESYERVKTNACPRIQQFDTEKPLSRNHQFITEISNIDSSLRQYILQQRESDDDGPKYLTRYPRKHVGSFQKKSSDKRRTQDLFFDLARREDRRRKKLKDGNNPYLLYKSHFKFEKVHSQEWMNY